MAIANPGPYSSNANYIRFKFESQEHQTMRQAKTGTNTHNNRRGGSQQTEPNGKRKMSNPSKSNTKSSNHQEMDQLILERQKLLAKLNEISDNGEIVEDGSTSLNQTKLINSHEDEDEEGEISESD